MKINGIKVNGVVYEIWATESDVQALNNQGNAALGTELESGKAMIAEAINNVGGSASEDESLAELAEDIEQMPIVNVGCFKFSSAPNLVSIITKQTINTVSTQWADADFRDKLIEINDTEGTITSIPAYCFNNFPNLKKVNLPECTSIGGYSFQNCNSLEYVNLPQCTSIGNFSFYKSYKNLTTWNTPMLQTAGAKIFENTSPAAERYVLKFESLLFANLAQNVDFGGAANNNVGNWTIKNILYPDREMTQWFMYAGTYANLTDCIKVEMPNGYDYTLNLYSNMRWTASTYLTSSADQWENRLTLYANLLEYTIKRLYDHSQDGVTRTFRLGFYATLYADSQLTTEPYGSYYTPLIKAMAAECIAECGRRNWTIQP